MVASNQVLDALKSIGLNLYERKLFVALLAKGVATAAELSEIANVPRSRSYDVLESLAEKGFVLVQPSKPLKYVAIKPSEAFERVKDKMQKDHEAMIERIDRLKGSSVMNELEGIFKQGLSFIQPEEITGTLKGRNNINRQLQSLFKSAKKDIFVLTTERGLKDIHSNHFRILKKVVKRGVKLKILAPQTNAEMLKIFSQIADVKPIKQATGRIYVVDGEHVVVSLTDDKVHESQDIAFWANSSHTAKDVILPYLNHLLKG